MTTARWAAGAFFAGCAATHLWTAVEMAYVSGASSATQMAGMAALVGMAGLESPAAWIMIGQHLIPHIAQIVGGAVFIGIARFRLELSVLPKEDAERLHAKERQFRAAFRQAPTGVGLASTSGPARNRLVQVNPALAAILGYEAESDLLGRDYLDLVAPSDRAGAEAAHAQLDAGVPVVEFDARLLRRDGSEIWTSVRACMFDESHSGGGAQGWPLIVAQVLDITEDRRREAELRHLADHDVLTQLFNRGRFEKELDRVVAASHRRNDVAALLLVDLDQFKYVNDTYGHGVGDHVLRAVADALRGRLRADDVIGRLGGDEFGILCPSTGPEAARALAQKLLRTVHDEAQITVGTRISARRSPRTDSGCGSSRS